MESFWNYNGVPSPWHFIVAFYFAFAFVGARFFLDRFIFRRLAIWLLGRGTNQRRYNKETKAKISKFTESMWKLMYYATVEFCTLATAYHEPWFTDVKQYYTGWPHQQLKLPMKLIYMCQCGFYIYSIAALLIWETRRKDFSVMMSHHVVTVVLISYSYTVRFIRPGIVILALHDASDVFLEAAKVFKYGEKEIGASVCFGLFALSWLVLRLIIFPFWVIRSSSYYSCQAMDLSQPYIRGIYYVLNTMLLSLLIFHIYWWKLICAMIIKQLKSKGKVGEDIRSGFGKFIGEAIQICINAFHSYVATKKTSLFTRLVCREYSVAALLMWETRRKDFSVMMSHHVVTVVLISYSFTVRFVRPGIVILALHDASDVFLEAAKVFKYGEKEIGASVCFGLFALPWLVLGLIIFPFWIIRSSSYYSCQAMDLSEAYMYYVLNTMLLSLLVFHIYWWKLICVMIIKQLKSRGGRVGEDIRSGSEDDTSLN